MLGGLTFWALGLTAPVFWGVVMAVFCLLPLGAWIVWLPAAIWLMATGHVARGIVLIAVGAGIVSAVDNFLRPLLLAGRTKLNGLLMFISLLGGVSAFGILGIMLGPVIVATAVGLFEAYMGEVEKGRAV
jgi:predicted PurR-regulated permease PerM